MNAAKEIAGQLLRDELALFEGGGIDAAESGWTIQGLGMLRKYLSGGKFRLHVWDSRYRVDGVSMLHDHPWGFDSEIIAGIVNQRRFFKTPHRRVQYMEVAIVCGAGGGVQKAAIPVALEGLPLERLEEGQTYHQDADEIHESLPLDGSVTLIERHFNENTEIAHVYYPATGEWVSAEPRPAHPDEIVNILSYSLETWF